MLRALKNKARKSLDPYSVLYNVLAWVYGWMIRSPSVRRAALMRAFKDSRFDHSELWGASALPRNIVDAVLARYQPTSFLDVGCGTGRTLEYVAGKGLECLGLEGSLAALRSSPVPQLIRRVNLNRPVDLDRQFDLVWSYEVAEHIHAIYADTFLDTLVRHSPRVVMSAAPPGQGGTGHFNEQPPSYWIARMEERGYRYDNDFSAYIHTLPDNYSQNVMVFLLGTHRSVP